MKPGRFYLFLAAAAVLQLMLAARMAPTDDELYYWCWSKDLQASYFDHPPVTAYLIRISTSILGDSLLGVRLFACLCTICTLALIGTLTGRRGIPWLLITPMFALGSILMTPDTPLLFFWTTYAVWLVKMQGRESATWRQWALGGLLLGLGGLSKYTMVLAVPGAFVSFVLAAPHPRRHWIGGFALHLLVAMAVASPVLYYNLRHDFAPFRWQMAHASPDDSGFSLNNIVMHVGAQLTLFGLFAFTAIPWCLRQRRELLADNRLRVCFVQFLFPTFFFLYKGFVIHVEGNWPFICYMTLLPLILNWWDQLKEGTQKRWSLPGSFALPAGLTAIILAHMTWHLPMPAAADRLTQFQVRYETARRVSEWAKARDVDRIYATSYQLTSQLRFQHVDAKQLPGHGRPSQFSLQGVEVDPEPCVHVFLHRSKDHDFPEIRLEEHGEPSVVARFPEFVSGSLLGEYVVLRFESEAGPRDPLTFAKSSSRKTPLDQR